MLLNNYIRQLLISTHDATDIVEDCLEEKVTYSAWYEVLENIRWPVRNTVKFSIEESVVDCAWDCTHIP